MTVLIMGAPQEEHTQHIFSKLRSRGVDAAIIDSRSFPFELRLTFLPQSGGFRLTLPDGKKVTDETLQSVYWRNYNGVRIPSGILADPTQAHIAENDARGMFESFLALPGVKWVNGWQGFRLHQTKPLALHLLKPLGVRIPQTIVTNDPDDLTEARKAGGRHIFKPVQGGAHTRKLSEELFEPAHLNNLRLAPITLQEEIPGTNIRVFVIGAEVIACEVRAETLDFRDDPRAQVLEHKLPTEIAELAKKIAKTLHLTLAGIDFRLNEAGEYYYLEANPSPMFIGFEKLSGLPISDRLCDFLTEA